MTAPNYATEPLDVLLAAIPSLPRRMLDRLVARAIERMDDLDGDSDLEDGDEDRCPAMEDWSSTAAPQIASFHHGLRYHGDDDDNEMDQQPVTLN